MQIRRSDLTWNVVGDEVVILDLTGSVYLKLNGSARLLWERLTATATEAEMCAALVDEYGIDGERAASDVQRFVSELSERGLIEE